MKKKSPAITVGILLIITIVASGSAFFWLESVKKNVHIKCGESYEGVCIEKISYDVATNDLVITLFNGLQEPLRVLNSETKGADTTYISLMTGAATGVGCEFVPLGKLACDSEGSVCNGFIKSKEIAEIRMLGSRELCKVPERAEYKLQINFGFGEQVREGFEV